MPYYAGKGHGQRAFRKGGPHRSRVLILDRSNEAEALKTEIELIANWGRRDIGTGVLLNRTNGGDMPPRSQKGKPQPAHSVETRAKISATMRARGIRPAEHIRKAANAANLGSKRSAECRNLLSKMKLGHMASKETRAKMSAAHMGNPGNPWGVKGKPQ